MIDMFYLVNNTGGLGEDVIAHWSGLAKIKETDIDIDKLPRNDAWRSTKNHRKMLALLNTKGKRARYLWSILKTSLPLAVALSKQDIQQEKWDKERKTLNDRIAQLEAFEERVKSEDKRREEAKGVGTQTDKEWTRLQSLLKHDVNLQLQRSELYIYIYIYSTGVYVPHYRDI